MTAVDATTGPTGIPPRPVHQRQLDDDMIRLHRAASASHRRGQIIEAVRNIAALAVAAGGLVVTAVGHGRTQLTVVGFAWFVISFLLLKNVMSATAKQGALLQEQFDTTLFHLPWRRTVAGDPVADHDIARLARRLPVGGKRDQRITAGWYDPTDGVHYPYDVLISQQQNLAWDARLRRTYSTRITAAAIIWVTIGIVIVGFVGGATVTQAIVSFYVPSLAALQLALEIRSGQLRVADERERLATMVDAELRNAKPGPVPASERDRLRGVARELQDGIFRTRLDVARVPEWLYRRNRTNDERDFGDTAEGHRTRLSA